MKSGEFGGKPGGGVSAFTIDPIPEILGCSTNNRVSGADPCHLTIDRRKKTLLVANYTGGNVSAVVNTIRWHTWTINRPQASRRLRSKEQQKGPHAHCIILDRSERYALAADLGIDKIMIYKFNTDRKTRTRVNNPECNFKAGAGPRHLTIHPNGRWVYVINELDSTMTALCYTTNETARSRRSKTVSTLPNDFSGVSYCADVHVSPSGQVSLWFKSEVTTVSLSSRSTRAPAN